MIMRLNFEKLMEKNGKIDLENTMFNSYQLEQFQNLIF